MASTTVHLPCAPRLSAMPVEILQLIIWSCLELNLCLVSKRMYQTLPSYKRLTRFLPLLAFGGDPILDKIIQNDGDDCSDIVRALGVATPLSYVERVRLQKLIGACDWFDLSYIVGVSQVLEEYWIQHLWIDKGMKTRPHRQARLDKRNNDKSEILIVLGRDQEGTVHRMEIGGLRIRINSGIRLGMYEEHFWDVPSYDAETTSEETTEEVVIPLVICCIPEKLLRGPLPHPKGYVKGEGPHRVSHLGRLAHSMPDFFTILCDIQRHMFSVAKTPGPFITSRQALDGATSEAISTKNYYVLDVFAHLRLATEDYLTSNKNTGLISWPPFTAEQFIAAARRPDEMALQLLFEYSHTGVFPYENEDVISWMQRAKIQAQDSPCNQRTFVDYLEYSRQSPCPVRYQIWKHSPECHCRLLWISR